MYISDLMENHGYKLVFKKGEFDGSYLAVNTMERVIYLMNTERHETKTIERLLLSADLQYSQKGRYE